MGYGSGSLLTSRVIFPVAAVARVRGLVRVVLALAGALLVVLQGHVGHGLLQASSAAPVLQQQNLPGKKKRGGLGLTAGHQILALCKSR